MKKFWNGLNPFVKIMTILGAALMIYGKVVKHLNIYFFWESFYIGYAFVTISLGAVLLVELLIIIKLFKDYYREGWRTAMHIFITGLIVFITTSFYFSESLDAVKNEIRTNVEVIELVGQVEGFGWFTTGSTSNVTDSNGISMSGAYYIIVKGKKAYTELLIAFRRKNDEPWELKIIEASR